MSRFALSFLLILVASSSVHAQDRLPDNTIKCADFRRVDAKTWVTTRTAYFDIGSVKGNGLPPHLMLQEGAFKLEGADLVDVLEGTCSRARAPL
ncbi:MAG: hypothetical protein JOZ16_05725 [Methylobacteriaceae bacterium]|nr:hypothetical protein [Methylobacteriaceae bacterium]